MRVACQVVRHVQALSKHVSLYGAVLDHEALMLTLSYIDSSHIDTRCAAVLCIVCM